MRSINDNFILLCFVTLNWTVNREMISQKVWMQMLMQIPRHLRHKVKHSNSLNVVHIFPQLWALYVRKVQSIFLSYINYSKISYHLPVLCSVLINIHTNIQICFWTSDQRKMQQNYLKWSRKKKSLDLWFYDFQMDCTSGALWSQ